LGIRISEPNAFARIHESPALSYRSDHVVSPVLASKFSYNMASKDLPVGIRLLIYSFLPLDILIKKTSCLSVRDREILVSETELLSQ
jgi:hypothetical protein